MRRELDPLTFQNYKIKNKGEKKKLNKEEKGELETQLAFPTYKKRERKN